MVKLIRGLLAVAFVAALTLSAQAEDKKPAKKDVKKKAPAPFANLFTYPKQVKLDDKQKEQVEALRAEYAPKLADLNKKQAGIVSPERIKEANAARKKASDAILPPERVKAAREAAKDKKGKEAGKAYNEALKLTAEEQAKLKGLNKVYDDALKITPEEKAQIAAINKERSALMKEINTKKVAILTAEQKEALKPKQPKTEKKPAPKTTNEKPVEKKPTEKKPTEKKPAEKK